MNRKQVLLFVMSLMSLMVHAQELKVKEMKVVPMDLTAISNKILDINGKACGLIKVQLKVKGTMFEGNVTNVEYKTNEYWVYMTDGSYMLSVKHPNYKTLKVNFRDYGIHSVESGKAYSLTLFVP